jgi:competence protein ComEA
MSGKPRVLAPPTAAVLVVLVFLGMLFSREVFLIGSPPAFLPSEQEFVHVELSGPGLESGVYQFYDGLTPQGVINLTDLSLADNSANISAWIRPLKNGESLKLIKKDQKIASLRRGWMPASHRIVMGIPLHPDQMSRNDWIALPGAGPVLADRIENDRQKNGEFGSYAALARVNGIGKKRLAGWKKFF